MKLKKFYEEPSLDLYKYNFAQIMEGGGDDGEEIAPSGLAGGAGGGAAGGGA